MSVCTCCACPFMPMAAALLSGCGSSGPSSLPPSLPCYTLLTSGVVVGGGGARRGRWHEGMRGAGDGGGSSQEEEGGGPGRHGEVVVVVRLKHTKTGEAMREPMRRVKREREERGVR